MDRALSSRSVIPTHTIHTYKHTQFVMLKSLHFGASLNGTVKQGYSYLNFDYGTDKTIDIPSYILYT